MLILDFLFAYPHFLGGKIQFKLLEGIMEMEEEVRRKIMEPFYTTKEPGEGTGLGLSETYKLLSDMGASISAANSPSGGATFTIEFANTQA